MMRLVLFIWLGLVNGKLPATIPGKADRDLSSMIGREMFEKMFPHHHPLYTYESFIKAAASFPLFAADGDPSVRKRELAAFFAHSAHETTSGGPGSVGGPYRWGLYYTEEQGCQGGQCAQYNTGGTSPFHPVAGKFYYGRGPLQISYAYNYGLAGEELGLPLLARPELVSSDGVIAFKTALWFWMKTQLPKPSCHDVVCGHWHPNAEDVRLGRRPGFGMTINIINGGVECHSMMAGSRSSRRERIGFYTWFAALLAVTTEQDCDCAGMGTYTN